MIDSRKELLRVLRYEKRLYGGKSICAFLPRFNEQGMIWKYIILLRKSEYLYNKKRKVSYLLTYSRLKRIGYKLGFTIPLNVVDEGLLIYHRGNLVINAEHIGKNFSTAGTAFMVAKGQTNEKPYLGDNISLGMNVTIIGGVRLASMIAVGAGSVVTKSFNKENITIAGNPAKIINEKEGSSSWGGWKNHFSNIN